MFKIATWNVNSLRVRLPQVIDWLKKNKPDVFALQETKIPDEQFPFDEIEKAGFNVIYSGQRTYNGVALISKKPFEDINKDLPGLEDPQRRVLTGTLGKYRVINLYVPNGESVGSEKYEYKLKWLQHLQRYIEDQLKQYPHLIVLGDFNIAPEDKDVYDPKAWEGNVLVSKKERQALQRLLKVGLYDCYRLFDSESGGYTWWNYRMAGFRRNMGLRIDLMLISEAMVKQRVSCQVDKRPRAAERPSDHAPLVAVFK